MAGHDKEAMRLRKEGKTYRQVADELDITEKQVNHAIDRERKRAGIRVKKKRKPETPILNLSDLHSGKETESFNCDVLDRRLRSLKTGALSILNILGQSYKFEDMVLNFLGDCIDGDAIYPTHTHHTDKKAPAGRQQISMLVDIVRPIIVDIHRETGLPLNLHGVRGNHGRVSKYTHEANNHDLMFYDQLKSSFSDNSKINVNVSEGFAKMIKVQGHGLLLYHGAGVRCYQNIPWYGIVQRVMRWQQSMKKDFIAAFLGHFHTLGHMRWIKTDIFLNGTAVSDDDFAMENLGMDGENSFWLIGCHPDRGLTWRFPVDLNRG